MVTILTNFNQFECVLQEQKLYPFLLGLCEWLLYIKAKNTVEARSNDRRYYDIPGITMIIIHQIFFRARDWPRRITWPNMPQLKLGNIREYAPGDIPQFSNFAIYVCAFSFCPEKIVHLDRTEHFK